MKSPNEVTVGIRLPDSKTHVFNTEETEPTAIKAMVDDWCLKQYGTKPKTTLYEVKRIPITTEGQVAWKSKFKVMDILRLIDKQHNMTKGGLYCANQVFELDSDIPVIETVDDYGLVVSLYETSFEATDVVLATNKTIMSEEEAVFTVEAKIDECYKEENVVGGKGDLFVNYFVGSEFITKIQHDKELQKALLVLIGEGK